jgi:hypothetical protein
VGSYEYLSQLHNLTVNDKGESCESAEQEREHGGVPGCLENCTSVARAIVAVSRPLQEHLTNCKIVIPPGECGNEHTVTVWHCHNTLHSCPEGSVLLYLSMHAAHESPNSKAILESCVLSLLKAGAKQGSDEALKDDVPVDAAAGQRDAAGTATTGDEAVPNTESSETAVQHCPDATFACFFTQDLPDTALLKLPAGVVCCCDTGGGTVMDSSFLEAEEVFSRLFPDTVFLTKAPAVGVGANTDGQDDQGDDLDSALKALGLV